MTGVIETLRAGLFGTPVPVRGRQRLDRDC